MGVGTRSSLDGKIRTSQGVLCQEREFLCSDELRGRSRTRVCFSFLVSIFYMSGFLLPSSRCHIMQAIRIKTHFHILFCVISKYFISEWTAKQRQKYTQGRLSSERFHLLNTVGFVYRINKFIKRKSTAREDKKWWEQLERLIHFLLEHGHVSIN